MPVNFLWDSSVTTFKGTATLQNVQHSATDWRYRGLRTNPSQTTLPNIS